MTAGEASVFNYYIDLHQFLQAGIPYDVIHGLSEEEYVYMKATPLALDERRKDFEK